MLKTFKAIIEKDGKIRPLEDVKLDQSRQVLVTILDEEDENNLHEPETPYLSEEALKKDWLKNEEDEAWRHLQQGK